MLAPEPIPSSIREAVSSSRSCGRGHPCSNQGSNHTRLLYMKGSTPECYGYCYTSSSTNSFTLISFSLKKLSHKDFNFPTVVVGGSFFVNGCFSPIDGPTHFKVIFIRPEDIFWGPDVLEVGFSSSIP